MLWKIWIIFYKKIILVFRSGSGKLDFCAGGPQISHRCCHERWWLRQPIRTRECVTSCLTANQNTRVCDVMSYSQSEHESVWHHVLQPIRTWECVTSCLTANQNMKVCDIMSYSQSEHESVWHHVLQPIRTRECVMSFLTANQSTDWPAKQLNIYQY